MNIESPLAKCLGEGFEGFGLIAGCDHHHGRASVAALKAYDATMAVRNRDSANVSELEALVA